LGDLKEGRMSDYRLERSKQEYQELLGLINQNMDLERWGLIQTYSRIIADAHPLVIYDSQWCRVMITYEAADYGDYRERTASVWYGRLHATNDGGYINLNGKNAKCWHGLYYYILNFLDGLSPEEVVDGKGHDPQVIHEFERSGLSWALPDENRIARALKELRLHNKMWEYYGQRLFDVFDLRNPALWEKYIQFHNEIKQLQYETWMTKEKIGKPFKQFDRFVPDELW
jgi:hypothetical protein